MGAISERDARVFAERAKMPMDEALRLAAAFELAHRVREQRAASRADLETSSSALAWLSERATMLDQEEAWLLSLDVELTLLDARLLAIGTRAKVALDISTVLRHALEMGASHLVLVHNHVEGPNAPSEVDMMFTVELREGASKVGMTLVDHVLVMRDGQAISVREFMQALAKKAPSKPARRKGQRK